MQSWNEQQASWDKLTLRVSGASEVCFAPSWGLTTLSSRADAAVKAALLSDGGNGEIINCYSPVRVYMCWACVRVYVCAAPCVFVCLFVCVCVCIRLQSQCLWWQGNETLCLKALWVNQRNLALIHPQWQWLTDTKKSRSHAPAQLCACTRTHTHTRTHARTHKQELCFDHSEVKSFTFHRITLVFQRPEKLRLLGSAVERQPKNG